MSREEALKTIQREVRKVRQESNYVEGLGEISPLYSHVGELLEEALKLGIDNIFTDKSKKDKLSSLTLYHAEELYEYLDEEGEIADVGVEYDRDYVIEISKELLRLLKEDIDNMESLGEEDTKENEFLKILNAVHNEVPDHIYIKYLNYGNIEDFIEDIWWMIEYRTTWAKYRTKDYFRYFRFIGVDPRRDFVNASELEGVDLNKLDTMTRKYIYSNKKIVDSIRVYPKEQTYYSVLDEWNSKTDRRFLQVRREDYKEYFLGSWVVRTSVFNSKSQKKVLGKVIELLNKEEMEYEGDKGLSAEARNVHIQQALNSTGTVKFRIGNTLFLVGDILVVFKEKEGQLAFVGREPLSNVNKALIRRYL